MTSKDKPSMIAEPYICTSDTGINQGEICWLFKHPDGRLFSMLPRYNSVDVVPRVVVHPSDRWQPYADFERKKLRELDAKGCDMEHVGVSGTLGYFLNFSKSFWGGGQHTSQVLLGYCGCDYRFDSESGRLLKRAEFLKAVCEKEGVEWLPSKCGSQCKLIGPRYCTEHGPVQPDQPKSGECPCLLGFPHFCKDGEALLTSTRGLCPCDCHKYDQPKSGEDEKPEHPLVKQGRMTLELIMQYYPSEVLAKLIDCEHAPEPSKCLPECKGGNGEDCSLGINCPCKCHDRMLQVGPSDGLIKAYIERAIQIHEAEEHEFRRALLDYIAVTQKNIVGLTLEGSRILDRHLEDLRKRFLPK